jgi:hypothetical protein
MAANLETALITRAPDISLGDLLADMRSWLDSRRIETIGFNVSKSEFEVRFKSFADARLFEQRFV